MSKVIAVTPFWATIFSSLIATSIIGGVGYAWSANADFKVLQERVETLQKTNIEPRLTTIEQQVKNTTETVHRIENGQEKMNEKLDRLVESQRNHR